MIRITLVLLILTGFILSFAQENLKNPVVIIEAGQEFQRQTGSGVLLGQEGNTLFFATAAHVVNGATNLTVRFRTRATPVLAEIVKINHQLDLAVISCTQPTGFEVLGSFKISDQNIQIEQSVTVIGHPFGNEWDINRRGAVKETEYNFDNRMFTLYPGAIKPGNSGGPVLNQNLEWIGMVQQVDQIKVVCLETSMIKKVCQSWAVPLNYLNGVESSPSSTSSTPSPNTATPKSYTDPLIGEMIFVEGGSFDMGSNDGKADEIPIHRVTVPDFYIGKYEVTQTQWGEIMKHNPSANKDCDQCPVENISWDDIQEFLRQINMRSSYTYRLPTEAEWEYAAGGGERTNRTIYAGTNNTSQLYRYGNFCNQSCTGTWRDDSQEDGYIKTSPVGGFFQNQLGLYDMSGNVWEWCEDWYHQDYSNAPLQGVAWIKPTGTKRTLRGGSYSYGPNGCRVSDRGGYESFRKFQDGGFRLARSL